MFAFAVVFVTSVCDKSECRMIADWLGFAFVDEVAAEQGACEGHNGVRGLSAHAIRGGSPAVRLASRAAKVVCSAGVVSTSAEVRSQAFVSNVAASVFRGTC